jgi:drug/metabolite transporter (DMT)-like permease
VPRPVAAAAALVSVEGVALLVFAVVSVILTALDDAGSIPLALGGALLLAVFGAVLFFLARKLRELKPPARSPVVAVQIVALPIGWTLANDNGRPEIGLPILAVAVAIIALLFATAAARDSLARDL